MIANSARRFSNLNTRKYYWQKSLIRWITVWQDYEHLQIWPSVFRHWQHCDYVARLQFTIIMFSEICGWEEYVQFWQKCEAEKLEMLENWYKRYKMRNGARISIRPPPPLPKKKKTDLPFQSFCFSRKFPSVLDRTFESHYICIITWLQPEFREFFTEKKGKQPLLIKVIRTRLTRTTRLPYFPWR